MKKTIIAAAQSVSKRGNVEENLKSHHRLIDLAAQHQVDLIFFPELSLTGYELDLASELAFTSNDTRLQSLHAASKQHGMTIVVGAPFKDEGQLHIASFIFYPNGSLNVYSKQFLHPGQEDLVFSYGAEDVVIPIHNEKIFCSICADLAHTEHAAKAFAHKSSIYMSSVLVSTGGYQTDTNILASYAKEFDMMVIMANHGGPSGGYETAGKSAVWLNNGELLHAIESDGEGLLVLTKEDGLWSAKVA